MGLNSTPSSERVHIGIFGKRNAGKSSVINAITNQSLAIVSDIKGTTTDPVSKAMELLPLGPVMIIDTPGLDDVGELGKMRIQKSYQVLNKSDIGILVVDGTLGQTDEDKALINKFNNGKQSFFSAYIRRNFCVARPCGVFPIPHRFLKKPDKNFYQNALSLHFPEIHFRYF